MKSSLYTLKDTTLDQFTVFYQYEKLSLITFRQYIGTTMRERDISTLERRDNSDLLAAAEIVKWNQQILHLIGIWAEKPKNLRFSLFFSYLTIHLTLEYAYLYQNIKNLESVVGNMTESIPFTLVFLKIVWFRKKENILRNIIQKLNEYLAICDYKTDQEAKIFLRYNAIAKNFVRTVVPLIFLSSIVYYAKPLFVRFIKPYEENSTSIYELPYRIQNDIFYDITDVHSYVIIYALQMPLVLIVSFGITGPDCLLITTVFYVCGELSILAIRIKNLDYNSQGSYETIKIFINRHVELIQMAKMIEDIFNILLLVQLFGATFLICFLGYNVLANTTDGQGTDLLNFTIYGFSVVVFVYVYCYIGNCLIEESLKVQDAFFYCAWYNLPAKYSKSFVTCIVQSQRPLYLTAGKFYIFSLPRFADVIRTSIAYLSVLRRLL